MSPAKRIIAFANQKGGVGKTTTVVNLAAALAARHKRLLLIDLDPQAHLTTHFGIDPNQAPYTSYDVLTQSAPLDQALIRQQENIMVLPSSLDLAGAEQELVAVVGREIILRDAIRHCTPDIDYLFIDCPPSLGLLTLNALGAADELFIPLQPQFLALKGLSQLLETVVLIQQRINKNLKVTGLIFCMFDSRVSLTKEIVNDIEHFFTQHPGTDSPWRDIRIFDTRIRCNIKLAESPGYGQTIFEYEPDCHGANDYMSLAEEVEQGAAVTAPASPNDGALHAPQPFADNKTISMDSSGGAGSPAPSLAAGDAFESGENPQDQSIHEQTLSTGD